MGFRTAPRERLSGLPPLAGSAILAALAIIACLWPGSQPAPPGLADYAYSSPAYVRIFALSFAASAVLYALGVWQRTRNARTLVRWSGVIALIAWAISEFLTIIFTVLSYMADTG